MQDIWVYIHERDGEIEEATFGLVIEARRILAQSGEPGQVTGVALGSVSEALLETLGGHGIQRVVRAENDQMRRYQGEVFARVLFALVEQEDPTCLLMAQTPETEDLAQRVAAMMNTALVTRAVDFNMTDDDGAQAIRPVANGYLFEDLALAMRPAPIILFLPAVLMDSPPDCDDKATVTTVPIWDPVEDLRTRTVEVIEAAPEDLDLKEADVIVAGGRGMGRGTSFEPIHALARAIGGTVGGTRPIIDWGDLPHERQIGQTGEYVSPRLIVNCGISGANEYTAGMEKSQQVIAIDLNPRARIFRFADLGVIGDVHEILPLLISKIEERK